MSRRHHRVIRGRHRIGTAGLVHCTEFAAVAAVLGVRRKSWFSAFIVPAKHSLAGLRRRAVTAEVSWAPAVAQ